MFKQVIIMPFIIALVVGFVMSFTVITQAADGPETSPSMQMPMKDVMEMDKSEANCCSHE